MDKNRITMNSTSNPIDKKWKVVKPKLAYDKYVIVPADWKCSCYKDDDYLKTGCTCHIGYIAGLSYGWEKREVVEHMVGLHNASLTK